MNSNTLKQQHTDLSLTIQGKTEWHTPHWNDQKSALLYLRSVQKKFDQFPKKQNKYMYMYMYISNSCC